MNERFMLMEHAHNNFVVTIWSDGSLRIETTYKVRVNIGHFFHTWRNFDCEATTFPRYALEMVDGVVSEYIDWKVACDESI
jgi:hypothetical protein